MEIEDFFYQGLLNNEENKMVSLLQFLDGKKVIIAGVITTTAALLVVKHVIDADIAAYVNAITTLLFGSASVATTSLRSNGSL